VFDAEPLHGDLGKADIVGSIPTWPMQRFLRKRKYRSEVIFMAGLEEYAKRMDVRGMMLTAVITALALVVGLFWNDAIRSAIETIVPPSDTLSYKFIAAMMVTVIVVFIAWLLVKTNEISKKHEKELERLAQKQKEIIGQQRKKLRERSDKLRRALIRKRI